MHAYHSNGSALFICYLHKRLFIELPPRFFPCLRCWCKEPLLDSCLFILFNKAWELHRQLNQPLPGSLCNHQKLCSRWGQCLSLKSISITRNILKLHFYPKIFVRPLEKEWILSWVIKLSLAVSTHVICRCLHFFKLHLDYSVARKEEIRVTSHNNICFWLMCI